MISSEELNLLKPSVSIINTARGGIVDETALHAFLSSNTDSFASFDVFSQEPALDNPLFQLPNFLELRIAQALPMRVLLQWVWQQ